VALSAADNAHAAVGRLNADNSRRGQLLYPVIAQSGSLTGVITRDGLQRAMSDGTGAVRTLGELAKTDPLTADAGEPLRVVVHRMAETGVTRMPVLESGRLVGMVSLSDLLRARTRSLEEERKRERVLRLRIPFGRLTDNVPKT
jgi:signal-transduction protein with cAMP-binding, CBS, and nucleotidyltransferase domain